MPAPGSLELWLSAATAVTFAAIWLIAVRAGGGPAGHGPLEAALFVTALASGLSATAIALPTATPLARAAALLEPVAWTAALAGWIGRGHRLWQDLHPAARRGLLLAGLALVLAASLEPPSSRLHAAIEAGAALLGLLVLATLLRELDEDGFWKLKYLLAAVAAVLSLHLLAAERLLRAPGASADGLALGRAAIALLAAPLVLVSLRRLDAEALLLPVRGRALAAGALLAGLVTLYGAGVGWLTYELQEGLRDALPGQAPGLALAAGLAALLLLALAVASGRVQALARRLLGRAAGARFDYEQEWLRFIDTVGGGEEGGDDGLPLRVIRAVGEAVDATGGAVWLCGRGDRFELLAIRNLDRPPAPLVETRGLGALLRRLDGPLELDRLAAIPNAPPWPGWLPPPPRGWLILPLVHRGELLGFMVLAEPRAGRTLAPEERRLLRILGREAASYLAEDRATAALAEARQFTAFSRRFASLVHDLKNVVAELALAAANARRHLDDPEFRRDLQRSLDDTVARLRGLLERLRVGGGAEEADLVQLVAAAQGSRPGRRPRVAAAPERLPARVDGERLLAALRHLVDNGFEATGERGPVELGLRGEGEMAIIEVRDRGPGMPGAEGGRRRFRPFVTSKPNGLGLGLVTARDLVESLGGRLEVESRPGSGTTARIYLPRFEAAA